MRRTKFWKASACRSGRAVSTYGFSEYARRHGDFALAGAAALLAWRDDGAIAKAAIVVFGVTPEPVRLRDVEQALVGGKLDREAIGASIAAAKRIDAMSDAYVSAGYRSRLAGVMVERALAAAARKSAEIAA